MAYSKQDLANFKKIRRLTEKILIGIGSYIITEDRLVKRRNRSTHPVVKSYRDVLDAYSGFLKSTGNENGSKPTEDVAAELARMRTSK